MKNFSEFTVEELMSKNVFFVKGDHPLIDTLKRMSGEGFSSAIVERDNERDTFGILTRKDVVIEASENLESFSALKVRDLVTKPVISISKNVGIDHAIRLMRLAGVRRLIVMDNDQVVGVLSNSDIFELVVQLVGKNG